ncbi:hypothetical protein B0H65DRAFT_445875 [Neurospora tetraspora]|uniref:WSC domain-containing protein n=1 Tax=Neurospora tetraspora TaxID=94610 RepID=A0AAE0J6T1_9PEZI|nr:hypothetical protein B0H65DRAFT_445875 [Neurospora tetraspora]
MARQRAARLWACLALVASLCGNALAVGPSHDVAYCATVNTADMDSKDSDFQSMGLCYQTCAGAQEEYAFAVVWGKSCWCSNTQPNTANTVSTNQCENPCPGYPSDWCGGDSLYGYLKITGVKPSSTAAPASISTTTQQTTKTTTSATKPTTTAVVIIKTETEQTTAIKTVQSTVRETVTVIPSVKSSVASSTGVSSSTTLVTSVWFFAPSFIRSRQTMHSTVASWVHTTQTTNGPVTTDPTQPTTQTVTVGGTVRTVVVTPTPTATSGGQLAEPEPNGKKPLGIGAAVGIAIGVAAALGIIGVLLWIWYMRRRKQNEESGSSFSSPRGSSSGMKGATVTETRFAPDLVAWGDGPGSKRRSTLMPVDPRLNPYGNALFNGRNKSRESITSFQDNQDYSRRVVGQPRVLRAVNPDPINED